MCALNRALALSIFSVAGPTLSASLRSIKLGDEPPDRRRAETKTAFADFVRRPLSSVSLL